MALIPFPALPFDATWTPPVTKAQRNTSAWTGKSKIIGLANTGRWTCEVTFWPISTEDEERLLRAWLVNMDGQINATNIQRACQTPPGSSPIVAAGAVAGNTCPLSGMQPSSTILKAGDHITIPTGSTFRLVTLTADLVSNGSGAGTAQFRPEIIEAPSVGGTVSIYTPFSPMRLAQDDNPMPSADGVTSFTATFVEAN